MTRPVQAAGLTAADYRQITAIQGTLFFLHQDGTLSTWGLNTDLTGTGAAHTTLTPVPGLAQIAELAPNPSTLLLRKTDGTVWGWGNNYHELLGVSWNTLEGSLTPVQVPGLSGITRLFSLGFALDAQNRAWVWGRDSGGSKGMGVDFLHAEIVPPVLHTAFPANAVRTLQPGDGYTYVLEADGSLWRTGNMQSWTFQRLNTEHIIPDTYTTPPVHQPLTVQPDPVSASWISHTPGLHTYLDGDRVLLWAEPPLTHRCDGWLIDGLAVNTPAVNLPDRDLTLYATFTRLTPAEGFDRWTAAHTLLLGTPGDCPMDDGITNLEKYLYGLDPATAYRPADLFQTRYDPGAGHMVLRIATAKTAFGVQITPQACGSLLNPAWDSDTIGSAKIGETDTHEIWELSLPLGATPRFMRLQYTLTGE